MSRPNSARRPNGQRHQRRRTSTTDTIARRHAITEISACLADRDAYVVGIPPGALLDFAFRLENVPVMTAWVDNGTNVVLKTSDLPVLAVAVTVMDFRAAAVVAIPKTVPAAVVRAAIDRDMPDDGSRDIVVLDDGGRLAYWPRLLVDALQRVDPAYTAQLHANEVGNLS